MNDLDDDEAEEILKKIDDIHNIAEILEAEVIPYSLEHYLDLGTSSNNSHLDELMKEDDEDDSADEGKV